MERITLSESVVNAPQNNTLPLTWPHPGLWRVEQIVASVDTGAAGTATHLGLTITRKDRPQVLVISGMGLVANDNNGVYWFPGVVADHEDANTHTIALPHIEIEEGDRIQAFERGHVDTTDWLEFIVTARKL